MTNRKAPYSHSDGSNCWTKDCSRRGGTEVVDHSSAGDKAQFRKEMEDMLPLLKRVPGWQEELEAENEYDDKFDDYGRLKNPPPPPSPSPSPSSPPPPPPPPLESPPLDDKAQFRKEMEDMLPLLKRVPGWQEELEAENGYDDDKNSDEQGPPPPPSSPPPPPPPLESSLVDDKAQFRKEMEDMLPLLKRVPGWQEELEAENDYDDDDEWEEQGPPLPLENFLVDPQRGVMGLSTSLIEAERVAFENIPESRWKQKYQHMVIGDLSKLSDYKYSAHVEARNKNVTEKVNECVSILNDVHKYSLGRSSKFEEYRLGLRIKSLNKAVSEEFNNPLSSREQTAVFDRKWAEVEANPVVVNLKEVNPALRSAFEFGKSQPQ